MLQSRNRLKIFAFSVHTRRLVAPFLPKFYSKIRGVIYLLDIPVKLWKSWIIIGEEEFTKAGALKKT